MNIRNQVEARMKELDMTSYQLAKAVEQFGIRPQTVYDFTAGRSKINDVYLGHILGVLRLKIVPWS